MHISEREEEIHHKDRKKRYADHMDFIIFMKLEVVHKRREKAVEKDRDHRRESYAREKARISRKMHRKISIVPVIDTAELFNSVTE